MHRQTFERFYKSSLQWTKLCHKVEFVHLQLKSCTKILTRTGTRNISHLLSWPQTCYEYKLLLTAQNTLTIAGSWVTAVCCKDVAFGGSQTWRSLMSLPRKIMYSNTSSLGGTGWSVGLSSVPNDLTATTRFTSEYHELFVPLIISTRDRLYHGLFIPQTVDNIFGIIKAERIQTSK